MRSIRFATRPGSLALALSLTLVAAPTFAESPTFRGPDRDGIYTATGLVDKWPKAGPKKLWSTTGLGEGYASLAIHDGRIYTTGKNGNQGFAQAFDLNGKSLWKTGYGVDREPG